MVPPRPRLRALDATVQADEGRRVLALRDPAGYSDAIVLVPWKLVPALRRFDGARTCEEIVASLGPGAPELRDVTRLAADLDARGLLDSPRYTALKAAAEARWRALPVRPAHLAGGAYEDDPVALRATLDRLFARAAPPRAATLPPPSRGSLPPSKGSLPPPAPVPTVRALIAPHIDLHRGGEAYGVAYGSLRARSTADTFFVFGTSHAPMEGVLALTDKDFDTPLGRVQTARDLIDALERRLPGVDLRAGEYCHRAEHSIEFQALWLRHVFPARAIRIVPILTGALPSPLDREASERLELALSAVRAELSLLGPRGCVIAGADLAHVGPRFGDPRPHDAAARARLAVRDRESLSFALARDPEGWARDVRRDDHARRVCGLAPIYALASVLPPAWRARGRLVRYDQCVDPEDGSLVSHAVGLFEG